SFARTRIARRAAFLRRAPLCRIDLAPILRAFLAALAPARQDLLLVRSIVRAIEPEQLFPELRIVRVALAAAFGWRERSRLALAFTLLDTAPLAPAMFARALAMAGHGRRSPDAETRAPISGKAEIGVALQA